MTRSTAAAALVLLAVAVTDVLPPVDRRVFLTNRRISAAGYYGSSISDIRASMSATLTKASRAAEVRLAVKVDASRIAFSAAEGRHVAELDIVIDVAFSPVT